MRLSADQARIPHKVLLHGLIGSALFTAILFLTNPYFSVLEDETSIVEAANAPVAQTLKLFTTGVGQHEHPPLSDLLLHFWLPVAGVSPVLVRLPSILLYSLALLVFASVAYKLHGTIAFYGTMVFGMFWPFGFHFGRLAGWYSLCFLIVGILTLFYIRFLEQPVWKRWFLVLVASFAAVTTNYFCWLIVALILLDAICRLPFRAGARYVVAGLAILAVAYGPLWITLVHEAEGANSAATGHGILGTMLNAGFNLYALFISESVAPWYWFLSIPAGLAVGLTILTIPLLIQNSARRLYFGFLVLFVIMAATGIIGTKRLLFISGWLLVPIGCALSNPKRPRLRAMLAASLMVVVAVGWFGISSRRHYAALHFLEPWPALAKDAAQNVGRGVLVVSNSPSFLFYLNTALYDLHLSTTDRAGWASGPNVISLIRSDLPATLPAKELLFVRGVNTSATERTALAEQSLASKCRLESSVSLLPDDGFKLKKEFFHVDIDDPYRIHVERFDCRR